MSDLLKTHGDDAPSGQNLEYDPDFTAMELAAQPEEERQAGDEIVEGKDPDFKDVAKKARAVLERAHDLRAAVYLADADLRINGLEGFAEVTKFIRFCLEDHWDTCHPELDADDDDDPTMRINAITNLSGRNTVLRSLRRAAALTESRALGRITLRDIEVSKGEVSPGEDETPKSQSEIEAAFLDTDDDRLKLLLESATSALNDVNAIDAVFMEKTPGFGPSLEPLQQMLGRIVNILADAVGEEAVVDGAGIGGDSAAAPMQAASGSAPSVPGQVATRADVTAALDRIIDYYAKYEPSSPLPVLLKRARRLVGADFIKIINDLAPLGLDNVNLVGGISGEESE